MLQLTTAQFLDMDCFLRCMGGNEDIESVEDVNVLVVVVVVVDDDDDDSFVGDFGGRLFDIPTQ